MATADLSPATAARLRSLRLRMTALIALLATAAVTVFAVVVIRLDRQLRDEQLDTELLRIGDTAARQLSFDDGLIQPEAPSIADTVVTVTPSFSIAEFRQQQERYGFPDPERAEIDEYVRLAFEEAEFDSKVFLLGLVLEENGFEALLEEIDFDELFEEEATTVGPAEIENDEGEPEIVGPIELVYDDALDQLLADPPEDLADEAYRRYVTVQADEADVELEFETAVFVNPAISLTEESLFVISDTVTENASEPLRRTVADDAGERWDVRATALRDGPEVRGAVIAIIDPSEFDAAHDDLRTRVIVLALAIVAGSVVAAWFVAARTIRPTGQALAQQERFLADAAHELRTPIAAIRLTAESADAATASTNLARVAELAADASTLTDDLLTLARMDADRMELQRQRVRLDLLVESTVAAIPGAAESTMIEGDAPVVEADPRLMERAIGNLVRNAIAHGGASAERPAEITITSAGAGAVVTVRDHGPGVEPEVADALFERFRSRTGSAGHGLGLALARWIARAHGGELEIASPAGGGAAFVLTIPD
ncbi:MAG: HAMP domain-containing sensor histidine kinase [Actinomycetota bacterium]